MEGLRRIFLGSSFGVLAFLFFEILVLVLAWTGKVGNDAYIGLALFLHLVFSYAILLNLLPIFGLAVGGAVTGAPSGTASQTAGNAVSWWIRSTQGIAFSVTLLILSLFLLDYQFSMGMFFFAGILLLVWGQYALAFPGVSAWPQRISAGILLLITLGVVAMSVSPDVAKFLTGRPFWSGAEYKASAIGQKTMARNENEYRRKGIHRVNLAIEKRGVRNDEELKKLVGKDFSQEDLDFFLESRDGKWNTVPKIIQGGLEGTKSVSLPKINKAPWEVEYRTRFGNPETITLPEGKWEVEIIPHGSDLYRFACPGEGGVASIFPPPNGTGALRVGGAKHGESFQSYGSAKVVMDHQNNNNGWGCTITDPIDVTIRLKPKWF